MRNIKDLISVGNRLLICLKSVDIFSQAKFFRLFRFSRGGFAARVAIVFLPKRRNKLYISEKKLRVFKLDQRVRAGVLKQARVKVWSLSYE